MAFFADLSPFEYGGAEPDTAILNVGWLSLDQSYPAGSPDKEFITALRRIVASPVNLYRGSHLCEFCPAPSTILSPGGIPMLDPPPDITGNGEIWVPDGRGTTYVAPVLVLHYIVEHHYAPPDAFVDAVLRAE